MGNAYMEQQVQEGVIAEKYILNTLLTLCPELTKYTWTKLDPMYPMDFVGVSDMDTVYLEIKNRETVMSTDFGDIIMPISKYNCHTQVIERCFLVTRYRDKIFVTHITPGYHTVIPITRKDFKERGNVGVEAAHVVWSQSSPNTMLVGEYK